MINYRIKNVTDMALFRKKITSRSSRLLAPYIPNCVSTFFHFRVNTGKGWVRILPPCDSNSLLRPQRISLHLFPLQAVNSCTSLSPRIGIRSGMDNLENI